MILPNVYIISVAKIKRGINMKKVKNKNNIKMFYELELNNNRICILDSNKDYFNDLSLDYNEKVKDEETAIRKMLEETDLQSMCGFFNARKYDNLQELCKYEEFDTELDAINNPNINKFIINNKAYYTIID